MMNPVKDIIFRLLSPQRRFEHIYKTNQWKSDESVSGPGSELAATAALREALPELIRDLGIRSIVDAPCGDMNWMRHVLDEVEVDYTGLDIVPALIERNRAACPQLTFAHANLISDPLPRADLIVSRDCFIHLSFADTAAAIRNMKRSGSTYLLANSYPGVVENRDIDTGRWRFMDLCRPPYNYPAPLRRIVETEAGKEMWLWRLDSL